MPEEVYSLKSKSGSKLDMKTPVLDKMNLLDYCTSFQSKDSDGAKSKESCKMSRMDRGSDSLFMDIDAQEYETDPFFCMSFLQASLAATALEDILTALTILEECNSKLRISKVLNDMPILLVKKYGIAQPPKTDELDIINVNDLNCLENKLLKLENDRNQLGHLLRELYVSLVLNRSYRPLWNHIVDVDDQAQHIPMLIEQEIKNQTQLKAIMRQLRQQRNQNKTKIYDSEFVVDSLKKQIEDADLTAAIRERYVESWQGARTEQHVETINEREVTKLNSITHYKQLYDQESRVHSEIDALVHIIISDNLKQVEEWMTKYEEDMEEIDLKIQIQRSDYQNAWDQRRHLERTYSKHDQEMREWNKFKEDRAIAQKYHNDMTRSAVVVQAWWRGILVRLKLGPFRAPKKRGGGQKKK